MLRFPLRANTLLYPGSIPNTTTGMPPSAVSAFKTIAMCEGLPHARPARLRARSGCLRPIFVPLPTEFRAELVRTTLGAALRRRPGAAPRACALCPLRNCLLTGRLLSHLSLPQTVNGAAPSKSISACHRIWRLPVPQKHHGPIRAELEAEKCSPRPVAGHEYQRRQSDGTLRLHGEAFRTELKTRIPAARFQG